MGSERIVVANFVGEGAIRKGALCTILRVPGDDDSMLVSALSTGGRRIEAWINKRSLANPRIKAWVSPRVREAGYPQYHGRSAEKIVACINRRREDGLD